MRALNIPARYCYGYLPDIDVTPTDQPMDFVAWLEAYLGGAWHTFDPRNNSRRIGRLLVGRGRDAVDVAEVTSYGGAPLVAMRVVAEDAALPPWSSAGLPVYGVFQP
jgi:transglutaminase-like putative cysteine protease